MATSRFFASPEEEDRILSLIERSRGTAVPDQPTIDRLQDSALAFPWVRGDVQLGLAQEGHDRNSPATKAIADSSARVKVKRNMGWHDALWDKVKVGTRTAFLTFESLADELIKRPFRTLAAASLEAAEEGEPLVGIFERLADNYRMAGDSAGLRAIQLLARGEPVDLGEGIFAGGLVVEEARKEAERLKFAGEPISFGRLLAYTVSEPGTRSYNVMSGLLDAFFTLSTDPTAVAGGTLAKIRKAEKLFTGPAELAPNFRRFAESVGLIQGRTKTVIPDAVDAWLDTDGSEVIEWIAKQKNVAEMRRRTKGQIPLQVLRDLADADHVGAVKAILRPQLGIGIRQKPTIQRFPDFHRRLDSVRLTHMLPHRHVDLDDLDNLATELERFGRNAKMPTEAIDLWINKLARVRDSRVGVYNVVGGTLSDTMVKLRMVDDVGKHQAKRMTKMFRNYQEELARYFVDEVGNNVPVLGATINGADHVLPTPHLFNEYINRSLPLPDPRAIRRMTSRYGRILNNLNLDKPLTVLEWMSQDIWKPLVLLRGAWTVRVVGEEQVRMGAAGLDSMLSHPIRAIAWITGRRGGKGLTGEAFKDASAVLGDLDEYGKAMSRKGGGWRDRVASFGYRVVYREEEEFVPALADELLQLQSDPIAFRVAGGLRKRDKVPGNLTGLDAVKEWFWAGTGQKFRKEMAQARGRGRLLNRKGADEYIDSVLHRLQVKTGKDPRLMAAVGTGKIGGESIRTGHRASERFTEVLSQLVDEGVGPQAAKGNITLVGRESLGGKTGAYLDRAVESAFTALMSKPTNLLSRSPAFRQFYWKRVEELMGFMDEAGQHAAIRAAKDAGLSRGQLRRLARSTQRGTGKLNLDDADLVAKGFGLEQTKNLLYDLTEKSQFFDIARIIFPFGEAWKEILTRWARLFTTEITPVRRFQQIVEGARGSGWFYVDDQTGQEMFAYPGFEFVSEKILGVPIKLQGTVTGLNLFSNTILPGFGPVVQVPAGMFLPDKPSWDAVREMVLPFGEIGGEAGPGEGPKGGFVEAMLPAWMQKFRQAGLTPFGRQDDRLWNNTIFDVARFLVSTGEYSTNSPEEVQKLMDAAKEKAKWLYAMRGAAQFVVPSAPSPQFLAFDQNGDFTTATRLVEEFRKLQDEDYDSAGIRFLETFGEGALLYMQSKSKSIVPGLPVSEEAVTFVRSNPDLVRDFPNVYGLFAPGGGDFDIAAYSRQFRTGEREALTAEEATRLANNRIASLIYVKAKETVGDRPSESQRDWLKQLKLALREEYPGYQDFTGLAERASTDTLLIELEKAASDPRIQKTETGKGLVLYLQARAQAYEAAKRAGLRTLSSKRLASTRDWLRDVADAISDEHPDFARIFEIILARELGGVDKEVSVVGTEEEAAV